MDRSKLTTPGMPATQEDTPGRCWRKGTFLKTVDKDKTEDVNAK
jgi:hypothetical protein